MRRLYVESNFVLELVFAQEQRGQCEVLLHAAEAAQFELGLPAFCLGEPLETLGRRHVDRRRLSDGIQREFSQLSRTDEYRETIEAVDLATNLLAVSAREDIERLENVYRRVAGVAMLAQVTSEVVFEGLRFRSEFDLDAQDAFVLASIVQHLQDAPNESGFVTKNTKDFDDPELRAYLGERGCRLMTNFGEAIGFAMHGT